MWAEGQSIENVSLARELIRTRSKWDALAALCLECHTLLKNNI